VGLDDDPFGLIDFPDTDTDMHDIDLLMPTSAPSTSTARGFFQADIESPNIEFQPLAIGYYISTAPAAGLPPNMWTQCESARRMLPAHFRAALHIRVNGNDMNEDQLLSGGGSKQCQHMLDSTHTADVLR